MTIISERRNRKKGRFARVRSMQEELLLDIPHCQVVFTITRMLRIFFKYNRKLLGELCCLALNTLTVYFKAASEEDLVAGLIATIQTFGGRINLHPHGHLHFLITEGGTDKKGAFHKAPRFDDDYLTEVFAGEVLGFPASSESAFRYPNSGWYHCISRFIILNDGARPKSAQKRSFSHSSGEGISYPIISFYLIFPLASSISG